MKNNLLTLLLLLTLTPLMAQDKKATSDLKSLKVDIPHISNSKGVDLYNVLNVPTHSFTHDGELVYYNGIPLIDSDYRKKTKVVEYVNEQYWLPGDAMMSAIPPQRFMQILYISNNGNLYYQWMKLDGADPDSFESIPTPDNRSVFDTNNNNDPKRLYSFYLKSRNRIYYRGTKLEGVNPEKFHFLTITSTIPNATYHIINYTSDSTNVYYLGIRIANADAASFEVLKSGFCKDKRSVYHKSEVVEGIDGSTFKELDYLHFKDTSGVYMLTYLPKCEHLDLKPDGGVECDGKLYYFLSKANRDSLLSGSSAVSQESDQPFSLRGHFGFQKENNVLKRIPADPATFEVVKQQRTHYYTKDANHVFINGKPIEGANPKHFRFISNNTSYSDYSADDKHVYFFGETVEDADPDTFVPMFGYDTYYDYFKDKNRIYYRGKLIKNLTPATFDISGFYVKLNGKVWLRIPHSNILTKELTAVDLATFTTYDRPLMYSPYYDLTPCPYAKDSKTVYYRGEPMQGVDIASFQPYQNSGYAYDKRNLFYNGKKISRANLFKPEDFKVIARMDAESPTEAFMHNVYAHDAEFYYYNELILPMCTPDKELTFYDGSRNELCTIYTFCDNNIYCRGKFVKKGTKDDIRTHYYGSYLSPFCNDNNNIYYEDKIIASASESLRAMDSEYAVIGNNRVYYKDSVIAVADIKTFRTESRGHYARDKHNLYYAGKKVENADVDSYWGLILGYAKDKNKLYYKGEVVKGGDAKSASYNFATYVYDDKHAYYQGNRYKRPR